MTTTHRKKDYFTIIFVILFCTIQIIQSAAGQINYVDLQTSLGKILGVQIKTTHNSGAFAFYGIPYAKAPIGERRFKKPVPHPSWAPRTLLATNYKSCCPQLDMNGSPHGSEDCLYLNIFVPVQTLESQTQFTANGRQLPVMVYIQGESFENGDAAVYGPEKLLDWGVIVVTFNYRLGALGFLSTGDEHSPGNYGLYDQLTVLEWIRDHIGSFSGDNSKVTLFGQGAGASSAIFHLISPLSVGLFHAVIAQSGSPLCSWSLETEPEEAAGKLALRVGCPASPSVEMLRCLRRTPSSRLLTAQHQGKIFGEYPHRMLPVVESPGSGTRRLLPADPRTLIRQAPRRIPLMMGYNRHETAFFYPLIMNQFNSSPSVKSFLEQRLLPRFIRSTILKKFNNPQTETKSQIEKDVLANVLFRYFNFLSPKNHTDLLTRFVNMSTDALYSSCIEETLQLYSSSTTKQLPEIIVPFRNVTYKYIYDHRGQNSMLNMILTGNSNHQNVVLTPNSITSPEVYSTNLHNSVCHGDELFNLFELKLASKKPIDNHDLRVERHMLALWTDFAKHGYAPFVSGPEVPQWPSYSVNKQVSYIISKDIHTRFEPEESGSSHFWTRYIPSIIAQAISAPIQNSPTEDWNGREIESIQYPSDERYTSVTKLKIFAWSMLSLSILLIMLVITLTVLLIYQRKKHTFQATGNNLYNVRETSARALRRAAANAAAASASNHSSTKRSRATTISTSQLY